MRIGEKIQILRKQRDISQEQLAEILNVSRQAISKWETGESMPDIENIVRLSGVFDVSTDYLLKAYHNDAPAIAQSQVNMTVNNEFIGSEFAENMFVEHEDDDYHIEGSFHGKDGRYKGGYNITFNFGGLIYPVALLVFLILGFGWGMWRQAWVAFPIAWVIEEIITYVKTGRLGISIYGVAGAVYLVIGFIWGLWHPGWIIFVAAWVLSEAVNVKKRKRPKRKNREYDEWRQQ